MSTFTKGALVTFALLAFLGVFLYGLGDALAPLLFSFGLAYFSFPLIKKLESKGIGRNISVVGVLLGILLILAAVTALVLPGIIADSTAFSKELPTMAKQAAEKIESAASNFGISLDLSKDNLENYFAQNRNEIVANVGTRATKLANNFFSGFIQWLLSILSLFLIPLFFFYVINDFEKISAELRSFIPESIRPKIKQYVDMSNTILSGYIRGQLSVAFILGCIYALGLSAIGLKFGFLIGVVSGLISIIPYAGFTLGFATALLVAIADSSGTEVIVGIVAIYGVAQALEGMIITPKLVGDKVGLGPLAAMLALIVGGNLLGFAGMVLGIPVAAIIKSAVIELKGEFQSISS